MKFYRSAILTAIITCLASVQPALADTHFVRTDGGHVAPYTNYVNAATNIQDAVDAATSGDLVLISNGTYNTTSQINITNAITVQGVSGDPSDVTIDVSAGPVNSRRCLFVSNATAIVSGLGLTGGSSGGGTGTPGGGGVLLDAGTVSNCFMFGNYSWNMGAAALVRGGLLTHCTTTGNTGQPSIGTGVKVQDGIVQYCTMTNNAIAQGGGAWVDGGTVRFCTILNNGVLTAGSKGGGVYINGTRGTGALTSRVEYCTIAGNSSQNGGGVFMTANGVSVALHAFAIIEHCIITNNTADTIGGGVTFGTGNFADIKVRNCLVSGNTAGTDGGGMHLTKGGSSTIPGGVENCTVSGNSAGGNGQGIYMDWGPVTPPPALGA